MIVKRLPGTYGLGLAWDSFARSFYLTLFVSTFSFHFPRVGICRHCGHAPNVHQASRSGAMIVWVCNAHKCDCDHYTPETR